MRLQSGIAEKVAGIPADRHTIKRALHNAIGLAVMHRFATVFKWFFLPKMMQEGTKLKIVANILTLEKAYGAIAPL